MPKPAALPAALEEVGRIRPPRATRLTELAFQTAGVWEIGTTGAMALPTHVDRVEYRTESGEEGTSAVVTAGQDGFDAVVVDAKGKGLVRMTGYRTVAMPAPLADDLAAPLKAAIVTAD